MIDPGKLRHRITVRRRPLLSEPRAGNRYGDFADSFSRLAQVRPMSGRVAAEAGQAQVSADLEVVMRFDSDTRTITDADRIVFDGTEYGIASPPFADAMAGTVRLRMQSTLAG